MTLITALLALSCSLVYAQESFEVPIQTVPVQSQSSKLYMISAVSLIGANALDAASSYGLKEGNPLLGSRFDGRAIAIKSGLTVGQIAIQHIFLKHHPERRKVFTVVNFCLTGALIAVSVHNFGLR